ncbi:hypothetical protein B0O99DRAFT_162668 [Bisporella sp. PMI_857]|nr:hypothetical protein B0O99DRAFT_162668 [Bisporella sp. PMI_857]
MAQVVEAITFLVAGDITGHISGSYLRVRGQLRQLQILEVSPPLAGICRYMLKVESTVENPDTPPMLVGMSAPGHVDLVIVQSAPDIRELKELFLMPLFNSVNAQKDSSATTSLVLHHVGVGGTFKKVGTFTMGRKFVSQAMFPKTTTLGDRYYEKFDGSNQYTIQII